MGGKQQHCEAASQTLMLHPPLDPLSPKHYSSRAVNRKRQQNNGPPLLGQVLAPSAVSRPQHTGAHQPTSTCPMNQQRPICPKSLIMLQPQYLTGCRPISIREHSWHAAATRILSPQQNSTRAIILARQPLSRARHYAPAPPMKGEHRGSRVHHPV